MKTTLLSLDFNDWRGFTGLMEFNPGRNVISGPNGSGKTRIPDAVSWNLTGKDTHGKADSELKSIVDGSPVQKSEHSVISKYDIDGQVREFGRCYYEKWSTKRGAAEKTKDGNQTKFTVDKIEVSKTKYNTAIEKAFGENYSLCSVLSAVTGMEWKKRREKLTSMAPPVDMEKAMDSYSEFVTLLKKRTPEDAKKQALDRKKIVFKGKKQSNPEENRKIENIGLDDINSIIPERQADVDKYGGASQMEAANTVIEAEKSVESAKAAIEKAKGGDQSENIEKLKEMNSELMEAEQKFLSLKRHAQKMIDENNQSIRVIEQEFKNQRENLKDHQEEREKLLNQYRSIKESTSESIDGICKECGQALPENTIHLKIENFNRDKSEKLEQNITRGKEIKAEIGLIEKTISEREAELLELEVIEPNPILKAESTLEIVELKKQISELSSVKLFFDIPAELTATLEATETRLKQAQETRAAVKASGESVQRLAELKTKKSELSAENDRIEKFLSLHQQYEQALADAIEKPVNDMFQTAYFKMFTELEKADEDGNFKQVSACIVMDKQKRPFETALSNGERIQVELDIIRVMQNHFGISAPVFVDNSESVTSPIELDCQFIELRAVKPYKHNMTDERIDKTEYNALSDTQKAKYSLIETLTKEV